MARRARATVVGLTRVPLIAWTMVGAGALYFISVLRMGPPGTGAKVLLALAAVVLIQLMLRVDPAWILSAGIVSTMFAGNWDQLGLSTTVAPNRVLLAAGMLAALVRAPAVRERPRLRLSGVHFMMVIALAYAVLSAVVAGTLGRRTAVLGLVDDYGALPFLMFVIAPTAFATEKQRRILLGALIATGVYLSVTAVFEKLGLRSLIVPSYINNPLIGNHFGRARGPFVEAAADGLALYACTIAATIAFLLWRRPWQRAIAAAVMVLGPVGMLLTVTRVIWLAAVVATATVLVTTASLRRFLAPIAAMGVIMAVAAFSFIPGLAAQAQQRQADQNPIYERQNTDAAALRMIAARPLFGFGWDRANENIDPYFRLNPNIPLIGAGAGFHNLYLQYAVALGLAGGVLWLLAVGLAMGSALARLAPPELRRWQIGLKGLLLAWAIVGATSPASYIFTTVLLWTWAGMVYGHAGQVTTYRQKSRRPRRASVVGGGGVVGVGRGFSGWVGQ